MMTPALAEALRAVAEHGASVEGDWWIIGSTAALLAGYHEFAPADVDLFGNTECMSAFVRSFGRRPVSGSAHDKFKSMPYQRIDVPNALPIEIMGGLAVLDGDQWRELSIKTRIEVSGFGAPLWIPSVEEQISIFKLFGRPKDLAKAALLSDLSG